MNERSANLVVVMVVLLVGRGEGVVTRTRISKVGGRTIETIWGGNWDPRLGGRYARSRCGDANIAMTLAASIIENR